MRLRRPSAIVAVFLLLGLGGCGGEGAQEPTTTVEASPANDRSPTPSGTGFDQEAWRRETIKRFGDEPKYADGSKLDYVDTARQLCAQEEHPDYEEQSLQAYMLETFCPHV